MSHLNPISLNFGELDSLSSVQQPSGPGRVAAVLIAITDCTENPEIVFTRRADHLNSHSGQVSFPGGHWEVEDKSLADTALRESHEEIGLSPDLVKLQGCISSRPSKDEVFVQPYVGLVPKGVILEASPDEIASIFHVPVRYFVEETPSTLDCLSRNGRTFRVPAWDFDGYDIWGLTAMFTYDLLKRMNIYIDTNGLPEREIGR